MFRVTWHFAFVCGVAASAAAQQAPDLPRQTVDLSGKVAAVRPGLLGVITAAGEQVLVKVDARPQEISVVGSAEPAFLRPGMLVRFQASFDRKGAVVSSIRQLEVISLRADTQLGLVADTRFGDGAGLNLFSNEEPAKKKAPETISYTVTGSLRGVKDRKLIVAASGTLVHAELAEKAKISVDVSDYSLAREGDAIQVNGWYYLGHKDRVFGDRISITTTRKLGAAEELPKKKADDEKTDRKSVEKSSPPTPGDQE